ncbi:hypothetical protein EVA_05364 [gut metagenome]|uniref:Uncharacterized protein n=1 Tax=gut metagenome TaxID=749906 RepID=J9D1T8_9ZZZZ
MKTEIPSRFHRKKTKVQRTDGGNTSDFNTAFQESFS